MRRITILTLVFVVEGTALLLALPLGSKLGAPAFGQLRLQWIGAVWGVSASLPPLLGLWLATHARRPPTTTLTRDLLCRVRPLFADCDMVSLAIISLAAGIAEETLFRGVAQTALAAVVGQAVAIVLTGAVFGLLHWISLTYAFYAGLLGAYFGLLLVAFDNLLVPIVAHAAYDLFGLIYLVHVRKAPSAAGAG